MPLLISYGNITKNWVRKDKDGKERNIVCQYYHIGASQYIPLALKQRWYIIGDNRSEDQEVSRKQLEQIFGKENAPKLNIWQRFGFLFLVGGVSLFAFISWLIDVSS